jgi:hypothetical protein
LFSWRYQESSLSEGDGEEHMEVLIVSVVGMLAFGGLFILLCPEWWSSSRGTLKEKKQPRAGTPQGARTSKPATSHRDGRRQVDPGPFGTGLESRQNTPAR